MNVRYCSRVSARIAVSAMALAAAASAPGPAGAAGAVGAVGTPGTAADTTARAGLERVIVDAAHPTGTLRTLQGVNGAPAPGMHKPPQFTFGGWNMPEDID